MTDDANKNGSVKHSAESMGLRHAGLRHVALNVINMADSLDFYTRLLGMKVEWKPDDDNVYLTSGTDNLALHKASHNAHDTEQSLDHIGIIIDDREDVPRWYEFLDSEGVKMASTVKDHRDGARSFYCYDPDANVVQVIYHPPISRGE